jgi:hypothetical protein
MAWTATDNEIHYARLRRIAELLTTLRDVARQAVEIQEDGNTALTDTEEITAAAANTFKNAVLKEFLTFFDDASIALGPKAAKARSGAMADFVKHMPPNF